METYTVEDIVGENSKRLFILESPHTNEIKSKIPASGQTGLVMSQELFNTSTPIGIAISNGEIDGIGILNACQFPLDEKAYQATPDILMEYMSIKNT